MTTPNLPLTAEQRATILSQAVLANTRPDMRIESQSAVQAVLVFGSKPNHLLHFLIGFLSCGLWWIVWLILAMTNTVTRKIITVGEYGQVEVRAL